MGHFSRLLGAALAAAACLAHAQSSCSSDSQPPPTRILERFTSADCATCWADKATPAARDGEIAVDWIVPTARGDDAALAAGATPDALARMQALHRPGPAPVDLSRHAVTRSPLHLRVVHGIAFNDYVGTSMAMDKAAGGPWHGWLLLVESLPAGEEHSPVPRNLVRNAMQVRWDRPGDDGRFDESRPMRIPEGAKPERLRVIGWLEDARGRIVAAAQSVCVPEGKR